MVTKELSLEPRELSAKYSRRRIFKETVCTHSKHKGHVRRRGILQHYDTCGLKFYDMLDLIDA